MLNCIIVLAQYGNQLPIPVLNESMNTSNATENSNKNVIFVSFVFFW